MMLSDDFEALVFLAAWPTGNRTSGLARKFRKFLASPAGRVSQVVAAHRLHLGTLSVNTGACSG